jgi:hypothetical protein
LPPIRPGATPTSIRSADGAIGLEDFYAVPSTSRFMFTPTRELWPADAVNSILPAIPTPRKLNGKFVTIKPATWLKQNRRVEQTSWAPGEPEIIEGRLISEGGWRDHPGARCLNLYRPPAPIVGDAAQAGRWLEHVARVYPGDDGEHAADWLAQRVQRPGVKPNHALLLGGAPGIGKDTILAPVRLAVGPWNFKDISPDNLMNPFTPHVRAVIMRINEAHDLGDSERLNRFKLYERTKIYAASPPEVLLCNEKFLPSYYVPNAVGLVVTTNHKNDGVYLPDDDRRHYVAWSPVKKEDLPAGYFDDLWDWLNGGGAGHVAAYLAQRDLSKFNAYAPPPLTAAFYDIVNAGRSPEDAQLADALDELLRPNICSLEIITTSKIGAALEFLHELRFRRALPHRMERCGYVSCRNPNAEDGLWRVNGRRQVLYAKAGLSPDEQLRAAADYVLKMTKTTGNS